MTTSEELREWATAEKLKPVGGLSDEAWEAICGMKTAQELTIFCAPDDHRRTFALLVACALEDE